MNDNNDNNTIDIPDKLPPIEVRKPSRQKLPGCYAKRVDDLKAALEEIKTNASILSAIRREFRKGLADCGSYGEELTLDRASEAIEQRN